jgi:hypothetical protein
VGIIILAMTLASASAAACAAFWLAGRIWARRRGRRRQGSHKAMREGRQGRVRILQGPQRYGAHLERVRRLADSWGAKRRE